MSKTLRKKRTITTPTKKKRLTRRRLSKRKISKHYRKGGQTEKELCPVCLEELDTKETKRPEKVYRFQCGHGLHSKCMYQLCLSGIHTCPLCKYESTLTCNEIISIMRDYEKYGI